MEKERKEKAEMERKEKRGKYVLALLGLPLLLALAITALANTLTEVQRVADDLTRLNETANAPNDLWSFAARLATYNRARLPAAPGRLPCPE